MNNVEKAAIISAIATVFLALLKFAAGFIFGSIALIADAIHSATDVIGSIAVFLGAKFSTIKSEKFPYGLYKLENLVALFLAFLILYTGYEILMDSFHSLFIPKEKISLIASLAALISLIISLILVKYKEKVALKENSPSMLAEAKHTWMDVYSTAIVFVAVVFSTFGISFLDSLAGILLSFFIFKAGIEIVIDSAKVLLDVSIDYATMKKIEEIIQKQKYFDIEKIIARNFGRYVFVDLMLKTKLTDFRQIDLLKTNLEREIKQRIPLIDKITIELEYEKKKIICYAVPVMEKSKKATILESFGSARYFALVKATNKPKENKILEIKFIENPYWQEQIRRGILAAEFLAKQNIDVLFVRKELSKRGAYYALKDFFVDIRITNKRSLDELLKEIGVKE